jgi:hypothetical protein
MKLTQRDRRALMLLGTAAVVVLGLEFVVRQREQAPAAASDDSIATAQARLQKVRQAAATLPGREQALKIAMTDLAARSKGVIDTETLPQAQAQLMQIARNMAGAQEPPIEIRNVEVGQARAFGDDYGEILVPMTFVCRIEQLVNLLADVSAAPELLTIGGLRVTAADHEEKTINVRLTLSGIVPRRLIPVKKGAGAL